MAATLQNLISKGCACLTETALSKTFKQKLTVIGSHYATIAAFKGASIEELNSFKTVEGTPCFRALTEKESDLITQLQSKLQTDKTIEENFIILLVSKFINKQLSMLRNMTIESLNANPILCNTLRFDNERDFVKYYAYASISKSIATSLGFLVQDQLLYSSEFVFDGSEYKAGHKTQWDLVIDRLGDVKSYFEIKSGPNDMDVAQIKHYADEIKRIEEQNEHAYIGITYGKPDVKSVTTSLLDTYIADWKDKVFIGRDLWDFVSGNSNYHNLLINQIKEVASACLTNGSIVPHIDARIEELIEEFHRKYASMDEYYQSLW